MIAVNATILGARPTGLGVYALNVIRALDAAGERLVVHTASPDPVALRHGALDRAPDLVRPERGRSGHVWRLLWVQTGLPLRLVGSNAQVLLNVLPEGPLISPTPQVTVVHDLLPLRYPAEYPRARLHFQLVVPVLLRRSRTVVVISEATRRDLLDRYDVAEERVRVVAPGYDSERFRPGAGGHHRDELLYVGNIAPHKNLLRMIQAFSLIAPVTTAKLVIRGRGKPQHEAVLRRRIEELRIGDRVDWHAYEPAETLPDLYRRARALILPSLHEGFGLTALEAMACGTPVIASSSSSIPEVVGDAACLVDPTDVPGMAVAMRTVLSDDAMASDLKVRGLRRATLFSWARTTEELLPHLRRVAAT